MRYGISLPPFGDFADARALADLAREAEAAGWDGVFLWDHMLFDATFHPIADPWVALAAVAMATERVKIGPMVTPLPRRRPWKLAREAVTLDRLSGGRLILGVGLGAPADWEFGQFGEPEDAKTRAVLLDEGLDILAKCWSGEPFTHDGAHYHLAEMRFLPRPAQLPRIPIWVAGNWPNKAPMRRAARWDGVFPLVGDGLEPLAPETWAEINATIAAHRTADAPFDRVHGGATPGEDRAAGAATVAPYAAAGVTWWMEDISPWRFGARWGGDWNPAASQRMGERVRQGPPRVTHDERTTS